jgi:hypothetical protein
VGAVEQARADEAARRRAQASERARELARLRSRLAAGDAVTREDLQRALRRAEESRAFAGEAHEHAADAHHRAATAHAAAAEMLELRTDEDSSLRAAVHRAAAQADLDSEQDDREGAHERPKPGRLGPQSDEQGA